MPEIQHQRPDPSDRFRSGLKFSLDQTQWVCGLFNITPNTQRHSRWKWSNTHRMKVSYVFKTKSKFSPICHMSLLQQVGLNGVKKTGWFMLLQSKNLDLFHLYSSLANNLVLWMCNSQTSGSQLLMIELSRTQSLPISKLFFMCF